MTSLEKPLGHGVTCFCWYIMMSFRCWTCAGVLSCLLALSGSKQRALKSKLATLSKLSSFVGSRFAKIVGDPWSSFCFLVQFSHVLSTPVLCQGGLALCLQSRLRWVWQKEFSPLTEWQLGPCSLTLFPSLRPGMGEWGLIKRDW